MRSHGCGLACYARSSGGGVRVLAPVHRLLYRHSSLYRLLGLKTSQKQPSYGVPPSYVHVDACGLARSAGGGIRVLAPVHRLLYRHSSLYRLFGLKTCKKQPSYGVPPSYVRSHGCGLARYARSAGGIRVLAPVHRLLYRWVIVVPPIRA